MNKDNQKTSAWSAQQLIGNVLRGGVLLSVTVVLVGAVIYLYRHGQNTANYASFTPGPAFTRNLHAILLGLVQLHGRAIIQFGIILLIATPIVRVLLSALSFWLKHDYLYVAITLLVMAIIVWSMLGGIA